MSHPEIHMMWMEAYHPLELPNQAAFASSPLPSGIASGSPLSSWNLLTWLFWGFHKVWTSDSHAELETSLASSFWNKGNKDGVSVHLLSRILVRIPEAGLRTSQLFQHPNLTQNQTEHWNPCVETMVLECSQHMVLPLHQWSVGPARDQRCVLPKKTSAKMKMKAINSNHTQIFFRKKKHTFTKTRINHETVSKTLITNRCFVSLPRGPFSIFPIFSPQGLRTVSMEIPSNRHCNHLIGNITLVPSNVWPLADLNGFLHHVLGKKLRICWK